MPDGFVQVNVNITKEDVLHLDAMMSIDGYDNRSAFMRGLIRQEYARRYSHPNPLITIAEAQALQPVER